MVLGFMSCYNYPAPSLVNRGMSRSVSAHFLTWVASSKVDASFKSHTFCLDGRKINTYPWIVVSDLHMGTSAMTSYGVFLFSVRRKWVLLNSSLRESYHGI